MEYIYSVIIFINFSIALYFFIKSHNAKKQICPIRIRESKRYFNGSVIDKNEDHLLKNHTFGLAAVKREAGVVIFSAQSKWADTGLLY